jgi:hypothetical protein
VGGGQPLIRRKDKNMLAEVDTSFLALAVALNGYFAWSTARLVA